MPPTASNQKQSHPSNHVFSDDVNPHISLKIQQFLNSIPSKNTNVWSVVYSGNIVAGHQHSLLQQAINSALKNV